MSLSTIQLYLLLLCGVLCVDSLVPTPVLIGAKYSENFNGLGTPPIGTLTPFIQGNTINGWWSSENSIISSDGDSHGRTVAAGLYNFGDNETNAERYLGGITSNNKKTIIFGVSLSTTEGITSITISFVGEQFRYGGDNPDNSIIVCDYVVLTEDQYENGGWGVNGEKSLWLDIPTLNVKGVPSEDGKPGPVRFLKTYSFSLSPPSFTNGTVLQIRFTYHGGRDGLGISDFEVMPTSSPQSPTGASPYISTTPTNAGPTSTYPPPPPAVSTPTTQEEPTSSKIPPPRPSNTPSPTPHPIAPLSSTPHNGLSKWILVSIVLSGLLAGVFILIGVIIVNHMKRRRYHPALVPQSSSSSSIESGPNNIPVWTPYALVNNELQEAHPLLGNQLGLDS